MEELNSWRKRRFAHLRRESLAAYGDLAHRHRSACDRWMKRIARATAAIFHYDDIRGNAGPTMCVACTMICGGVPRATLRNSWI